VGSQFRIYTSTCKFPWRQTFLTSHWFNSNTKWAKRECNSHLVIFAISRHNQYHMPWYTLLPLILLHINPETIQHLLVHILLHSLVCCMVVSQKSFMFYFFSSTLISSFMDRTRFLSVYASCTNVRILVKSSE
jgi:hypothetical protein